MTKKKDQTFVLLISTVYALLGTGINFLTRYFWQETPKFITKFNTDKANSLLFPSLNLFVHMATICD